MSTSTPDVVDLSLNSFLPFYCCRRRLTSRDHLPVLVWIEFPLSKPSSRSPYPKGRTFLRLTVVPRTISEKWTRLSTGALEWSELALPILERSLKFSGSPRVVTRGSSELGTWSLGICRLAGLGVNSEARGFKVMALKSGSGGESFFFVLRLSIGGVPS